MQESMAQNRTLSLLEVLEVWRHLRELTLHLLVSVFVLTWEFFGVFPAVLVDFLVTWMPRAVNRSRISKK